MGGKVEHFNGNIDRENDSLLDEISEQNRRKMHNIKNNLNTEIQNSKRESDKKGSNDTRIII